MCEQERNSSSGQTDLTGKKKKKKGKKGKKEKRKKSMTTNP
jgi:hypothetical protein